MERECKVMLDDAIVITEARTQTNQSFKPSSKLTTALLLFTLCLAAAAAAVLVLNRPAKNPGQDEENFVHTIVETCLTHLLMQIGREFNLCLLFFPDLHHTLRQISNVRAAIHLKGEYNPDRNDSVEWKNHVDQSHSQGDLRLEKNEIVIPHNGLYFVYSQASFRVSCSSNAGDDGDNTTPGPMVHLSHTVQRWSRAFGNDDDKDSYQTILHSVRTACQKTQANVSDEQGRWYSAIYMGAVFNLKKNDKLKTIMDERMLRDLEDDPGKTFFGVFAL
ncbi:Tumor necrosis factor TNF-alpha [Channa argus]|uniref:Tumor necrosis factor TNF-alpha n=1 Tax=Channa argus TaxID=215402 RepID=A0A6G1QZQ4_CHAAH|nr:Tumor necrosis factor TNF-alpha [Channa argus]